jgi:hypothetical protein
MTSKHQGNVIDYNFAPQRNYGLPYVVWYYEVIIIEYKTVSIIYFDCVHFCHNNLPNNKHFNLNIWLSRKLYVIIIIISLFLS